MCNAWQTSCTDNEELIDVEAFLVHANKALWTTKLLR
jgi:hypothetical protein